MAQVYTFTDSNGEVRLMAEIDPAPGGSQPAVSDGTTNIPAASAFVFPGGTLSEPSPGVASIDHLVQAATITLTSAEILALHTTQVEIVPAPGSGLIVCPLSLAAVMHFGTTPYATATAVQVGWAAFVNVVNVNILGSNADAFGFTVATNDSENLGDVVDMPLVLGNIAANPTGGDGTCAVAVVYATFAVT